VRREDSLRFTDHFSLKLPLCMVNMKCQLLAVFSWVALASASWTQVRKPSSLSSITLIALDMKRLTSSRTSTTAHPQNTTQAWAYRCTKSTSATLQTNASFPQSSISPTAWHLEILIRTLSSSGRVSRHSTTLQMIMVW
jgi:hypothetical protein